MSALSRVLRKWFSRKSKELSAAEAEALRAAFKARYHSFKLLLSANNKALEIMSRIEGALRGDRPFGMSFLRANCTAVSVNVFRIVQNMDQLAPGKYKDLFDRFQHIQEDINARLTRRKEPRGEVLVFPLSQVDKTMADQVGSKMANIGELHSRLHLPVPPGFVISSYAYHRFFEHNDLQMEINRRLQASEKGELDQLYSLSADIQQLIIRAQLPEDVERAIMDAHADLEKQMGRNVKVSMRSSALGEDSASTSFAGQYRSELNVSSENILQAYKEIVASKYSLQAAMYRLTRGILDEEIAMCVGCMAMVNAKSGGVTYSRNPLNIRDDSICISSVWGLPKSVVDGSVASDYFVVSRKGNQPGEIVRRDVKNKTVKFVCYPDEGVCRMDVMEEKGGEPSLTDEQILELARIAVMLEEYYGTPQDIEWAVDEEGKIVLLQCRPLTQTEGRQTEFVCTEDDVACDALLLQGDATASSGVAAGPAFVVRRNSDALLFPDGAVLVAAQALPRWAALLSRAAAVITEQGSVAGHLANVAREFGVPAVFGVQMATEKIESGVVLTVDADTRRIYRGRVESLLAKVQPSRKNLMEGSPVYEILREVSELIIPLHLLDPDSTEFKARNCRTLHDITRFCHEKSLKEMFSFGKEHHFSERASKQLVCDIPMQWWIINLDDGFREDVPGKFVHLSNISSVPMLALWEGITAIPWSGPPPVDTRGFMSVLLEASANPALDPSMPSEYANKNYFMISKNFCSLSSRFGFHFCTVEALVGERPNENYVSFNFKGGAADYGRRVRRAHLVANILEEFGFRAEVKEDAAFARLEGFEEGVMKEHLKLLGYLLMHTRQLDMVMSNDASFAQHRSKIFKDICSITDPAIIRIACAYGELEGAANELRGLL
ncbi:MAG: pyruvate, water dikinase [Deltaproteobacteria bacterium]|nr:pyruvate, water dikinase [Deltaproteobacteria bacterium]